MHLTAYALHVISETVYEITIGDAFARWFEALEAGAAKQVAGALEVVAATGPAFDPVKQSPSLLWFDDTGRAPAVGAGALASYWPGPGYGDLLAWHHEVVRFLDGPPFERALKQVDGVTASRALEGVRRLREALRSSWLGFVSDATGWRTGAPVSTRAVKSALEAVLALVGLGLDDLGERESGLRELTVTEAAPALRVLYGLDVPRQRLVALSGEALTRAYYGDSVRAAERRWESYLRRGQVERRLRGRPESP